MFNGNLFQILALRIFHTYYFTKLFLLNLRLLGGSHFNPNLVDKTLNFFHFNVLGGFNIIDEHFQLRFMDEINDLFRNFFKIEEHCISMIHVSMKLGRIELQICMGHQ